MSQSDTSVDRPAILTVLNYMDASVRLLLVLLCFQLKFTRTSAQEHSKASVDDTVSGVLQDRVEHSLNVLLLTLPASGHSASLLALGGELVRRGHNVTLITTDRTEFHFAEMTMRQTKEAGVAYVSAGESFMNFTKLQDSKTSIWKRIPTEVVLMAQELGKITAVFDGYLKHNPVDIVICNELLQPIIACINRGYQVPVIALGTKCQYQFHTYPAWPWPGILSGATSDDLTFIQRLRNMFEYHLGSFILKYVFRVVMGSIQQYCPDAGLNYVSTSVGVYLPHIVQTVIGFEYPRTISPLTSYVGPILTKTPDPISNDLMSWLDKKGNKKVIYISMGSYLMLSREEVVAILSAVIATQYSAVWALRTKTEDALVGLDIDQDRFFITKWAPQLSVLGHRAIRMAILHGGSNGLHEALYNEIPPIVIPVAGDQVANAGRVHYQNLGIHIPSRNLSEASITDAIKSIDRGNYQASVERLKINFVAAGGVERAAKLVEFYEAVGYSHLIPSYAKYNWSWVQYYNVDV